MIASLYQSFMTQGEDVRGAELRVETHVVPFAAPGIYFARQEVVRLDSQVERQLPRRKGKLNVSVLHVERVQVYDDEDGIRAVGCALAVADELGVVGLVKLELPVVLQRAVLAANRVHSRDERRQTGRVIEVPRL